MAKHCKTKVKVPLSPLEKPGLPESGLFRSPARGELARQGDRERESAEAATAARLFRKANPVHNPRIVLR